MKSLEEIATRWSVYDLLSANEALDVWEELERRSYEKAKADTRSRT